VPDETHSPSLRSWVESANDPATDFPPQNLPLGIVRRRGSDKPFGVGVAIGEDIVDVSAAVAAGLLPALEGSVLEASRADSLNALMGLGAAGRRALRNALSQLLRADSAEGRRAATLRDAILISRGEAEHALPAVIGDYTDFYASIYHATNVGTMLRPDNPLMPNYKWIPIGYHGRASSIVVSGTPVRRPSGQVAADGGAVSPRVVPTSRLDYEAEAGFYIGTGNGLGHPIAIEDAGEKLFGVCLLNDWSARDIQAWEYQPLGPFLSKSFATTISPWVVTVEALEPFRCAAFARRDEDPTPLPYLTSPKDRERGGIDMTVEVSLRSAQMQQQGMPPARLSVGRLADLYWTPAQLVTHHASNGCNLRPGDILGSGTISGPAREARGCLLELTWRGSEPLTLPTGELRRVLEDGDEVTMRGWCEREGARRIGFGECRGTVLPAL
jgi:fumarylacetoacetase